MAIRCSHANSAVEVQIGSPFRNDLRGLLGDTERKENGFLRVTARAVGVVLWKCKERSEVNLGRLC